MWKTAGRVKPQRRPGQVDANAALAGAMARATGDAARLGWWGELVSRDPEAPVAVPIGMSGLELAGTDHHRALEFGPAINFRELATRRGFRLGGRQFVGQLGEQLASAGADLALALSCGVSPALRTQMGTRALVAQPLAESELLEQRGCHIPNSGPVSTMWQWCISRSSRAVVIFASPKTFDHSVKLRFVVTMMLVRS